MTMYLLKISNGFLRIQSFEKLDNNSSRKWFIKEEQVKPTMKDYCICFSFDEKYCIYFWQLVAIRGFAMTRCTWHRPANNTFICY